MEETGGSYFERLLTKVSTPEELFGPISLKALEQDRFTRITSAKFWRRAEGAGAESTTGAPENPSH